MPNAAAHKRKVSVAGRHEWEATVERNPNDWRRNELVGLEPSLNLAELDFNWLGTGRDLDATGALQTIRLDNDIDGVPTMTISVLDPRGHLFNVKAGRMRPPIKKKYLVQRGRKIPASAAVVDEGWNPLVRPELVGRAMEVVFNGVAFRLVKVSYDHATGATELTFEHLWAYWLKRKKGELRASRAAVTRAEFILSMVRQIKTERIPFVCPRLHEKQKIEAQSQTLSAGAQAGTDAPNTGDGGFSPNARITVKNVPATAQQRRDLDLILWQAAQMGASRHVMIACVMAATQESGVRPLDHGDARRNDTVGYFQQGPEWIEAKGAKDPRQATKAFLDSEINSNSWSQKYGGLDRVPGGYEQAIKNVQVSIGGYAQWEEEATRTVESWGGRAGTTEGSASSGTTVSTPQSYQFTRNKDETSWAAAKRLAEEVNWHLFIVGQSIYYMSEADLYARRPRYTVRPDDDSVMNLAYDIDWGKAVSEATLSVNLDRWGAPVGSVIVLEDFGPPDGRWLVTANSRDWFSPMAELTLRQPGKARLEPPTQVATEAFDTESFTTGPVEERLFEACKTISDRGYPYIWGGGHRRAGYPDAGTGTPSKDSGPPPGFDCSGSVAAALKMAGLAYLTGPADTSGAMAGKFEAGKGSRCTIYASHTHVWIGFDERKDRFDTSPHSGDKIKARGPFLRGKMRNDTEGFSARHLRGM